MGRPLAGTVHEVRPTPTVRVFALARVAISKTSSSEAICSALAPAMRKTQNSPPMPRRRSACSMGADATSSLRTTVRTSMPISRH